MYQFESSVASYCRAFPANFTKAKGGHLLTHDGTEYLDFLSGCGSLNYGHNDSRLQDALVDYIRTDGIAMSLDLHTDAKQHFCETFDNVILKPRGMDYKFMFSGPTGTNAVEAALKIARKSTGRRNVITFTNAFHGCSLGSLALTGSSSHRGDYNPIGDGVTRLPFDGYQGQSWDTADYLASLLSDPSSGVDAPAAIILETIQGEGGLNTASGPWLRKIQSIAKEHGALFIIDDIQAGCGRSGSFFSFESMSIEPDIILMAKGLSGFGLPISMVLLKPAVDTLAPGEHNGTFRGNCHAFITAAKAIETFWADERFVADLSSKITYLTSQLDQIAVRNGLTRKGRGMMQGVAFHNPEDALETRSKCYEQGLIVECCGPHDEVLKLLPPLTVSKAELRQASQIIADAVQDVLHIKMAEVA